MSYATVDDFVVAFGNPEAVELSNLDNPEATAVNSAQIQRAIDDGEAEANGYLMAGGATLPLTSVPVALRNIVLDIARYRLDRYRRREDVRQRYEDAIARLKDFAKGLFDLGLDAGGTPVEEGAGNATVRYYTNAKRYTYDGLKDW